METCELKTDTMELFLQGIEQSQWLKHGKAVLEASIFIAEVSSTYSVGSSSYCCTAGTGEWDECGGALLGWLGQDQPDMCPGSTTHRPFLQDYPGGSVSGWVAWCIIDLVRGTKH